MDFLRRLLSVLTRAAVEAVDDELTRSTRSGKRSSDSSQRSGGGARSGQGASSRSHAPSSSGSSRVSHAEPHLWDVATRGLPPFAYEPHPDGEADPGEVVWTWVPYEEDPSQGKDRPVIVLAAVAEGLVIAQLTSKDHRLDAAQEAHWGRYWHPIGTGDWDPQRRPSQVRLDRLLIVRESAVRREGASVSRATYEGVVQALRAHWS